MPGGMQGLGLGFPELRDGTSTEEKLTEMRDYLFLLLENLKYLLSNLGTNNFNDAELSSLTAPVYKSIGSLEESLLTVQATAEGAQVKAENAEGAATQAQITAQGAQVTAANASGAATQAQLTADGASITAQNAAGQVAGLAFTINGLEVFNQGGKTYISGDHIRSGTIEGVELISRNPVNSTLLRVVGGELLLYNSQGIVNGNISIDTGAFSISSPGTTWAIPMRISNLNEEILIAANPLKLQSWGNMSISADGTIFIGTNAGSGGVTMGETGNDVRLVGNVYINGVLQ